MYVARSVCVRSTLHRLEEGGEMLKRKRGCRWGWRIEGHRGVERAGSRHLRLTAGHSRITGHK